jgi:1-acyl-sn-glycerol-3-phosphate acyltransferase
LSGRTHARYFPVPPLPRRGGRPDAFLWVWLYGYEIGYFLLKGLTRLLFRPLFRVRLVAGSGEMPPGGAILAANHQSYLDPALLQLVVRQRLTFVMTADFYRSPRAGWFFRLVGAIPVGRGRMGHGAVRRAAALLRRGQSVVVFPEGRLSVDDSLGLHPAQRGISVVARMGRAPVVPAAIDGSRRAWPRGARWLRTSDVRIAIGAPIRWEGAPTRESEQAFADLVMARIGALKERLPRARP